MEATHYIHPDLELIYGLVFKGCGLKFSNLSPEPESQEYAACNFQLDGQHIIFRMAKITPKKTGQFVTVWKRNEHGITQPFNISDNFDYFIIAVKKENQFGLFIFPKKVLHNNKILSDNTIEGKRGMRVYPAWDLTTSNQAKKTQQWQTKYFIDISKNKIIDPKKVTFLFELNSQDH
ncbi:MAG: MepB family protein [Ferruginibacter sp.]